jgi:hypothetical protein
LVDFKEQLLGVLGATVSCLQALEDLDSQQQPLVLQNRVSREPGEMTCRQVVMR